ncbi:hypothetical protein [Phytomonospora endophytica]|uniref:Tail assembly chaperone n=1 Tax=Phytomonospora endophytica TaxID=714109 RepID=A0A841FTF6_9ACTN|nr:hypothetical protein [Phytomonospora endophytica]MBB6039316.1 hypothetical protein [Phytomonospora endophytica]GIG69742.1 hypothetical protein Pen01_60370 [Phytomonospora endophytica]
MATRKGSSPRNAVPAETGSGATESIQDRYGPIEVPSLDQLSYAEVDRIKRVTNVDLFGANLKPGKRLAVLEWSARTRAGQPVSLTDIYNNGSMAGWQKVAALSDEDDADGEDADEDAEPPDPTRTPAAA